MTASEARELQKEGLWASVHNRLANAIKDSVSKGNSFVAVYTNEEDEYIWEQSFEALRKLGYTVIEPYMLETDSYKYTKYIEQMKHDGVISKDIKYTYKFTLIIWNDI